MQEITLWEGSTCPLCETKGINSKLKFFRLNLRVAALLCKHKKCPFPVSTNYPDTFVRVGRDGNIIPGSQSEKGWPKEDEDDSDDSPYISDGSEESVTFPDISEIKNLHKFSSENKNEKAAPEVDAFDISSIDFETDDSMDTYKLRNEITSLEMEITKSVENMKSVPPHVNRQGSTVLHNTSDNCKISSSPAAKAFINSDDYVCPDTHRKLDINDSRCVKMNENRVESCNDRKSGNIILRANDSLTSISGSLELTKMSEELTNCTQEVKIPVSNICTSDHKHADVQNTSNRNCQGEGHSDNGGSCEDVKSINHRNRSDNVENQLDTFSLADTSNPETKPPILIPLDTNDIVGNNLSMTHELQEELVSSESVTIKNGDFEMRACGNIEIVVIIDDKSTDCSDNNVKKQHDSVSVAGNSNLKAEPAVLNPLSAKNAVGIGLSENCELHVELMSSESVTFKKADDCEKDVCDSKEMVNVIADHKNSGCSDSAEKQLATLSVIDISNSKPELPVLLSPQSTKNTVENELHAELVNCESLTLKKEDDCEEICGNKEMVNTFEDHKNSDCSDNAENQLANLSVVDTSNSKPEPPVLSSPQSTKNTAGNSLPSKCELLAELVSSESVPFKRDDDCGKEMCGNKELVHILDDHDSDCGSSSVEKQFDTLSMADTSDPEPEPPFSNSQSTENTVENDLPIKQEIDSELASSKSISLKTGNECENKKCDNQELDIIFDGQENCEVYHIVTIDNDTSTDLFEDSRRYEVVNLDLGFCKNQKSRGAIGKRKTIKNRQSMRSEKSSVACSASENATPIVKLKIVDENGLFVCTTNTGPSNVPEVEKTNQLQEMSEKNKGHSKNCVCFLCKDSSKQKGITSHLDRELADLFTEERVIETHLTERDFPTEKEIMRDFVCYVSGSSSFQNTKLSPKKRKRRFHL